ncbi:hypothetical protein [Fundidesulfovibrio terrae]|uniref:hypothetical protein n=1 Tax=Fundidesulfovibrio terrae TaxID=2922866 RepID=UPI001FAF9AF8|nr:hypothetical protein [Fundidesulfovibrio terrae]
MRSFLLSTLWVITVAVNSGTTNVNVSMPESSFDSLLAAIQAMSANTALWNSSFFTQLFQLF